MIIGPPSPGKLSKVNNKLVIDCPAMKDNFEKLRKQLMPDPNELEEKYTRKRKTCRANQTPDLRELSDYPAHQVPKPKHISLVPKDTTHKSKMNQMQMKNF